MPFRGCDDGLQGECRKLVHANSSFIPYPHEMKLRWAISGDVSVPLSLTVHRGSCNHSCQGGALQDCSTDKQVFIWQNVTETFVTPDNDPFIKPLHYYCITAKIAEKNCCSVCTQTEYLQDFHEPVLSEKHDWKTPLLFLFVILVLLLLLVILIRKKGRAFNKKRKTFRLESAPLNNCHIDAEMKTYNVKVVCLYVKEEPQLENIRDLQTALRRGGLNVIDIYEEEENISRSLQNWSRENLEDSNSKIVIVETPLLRRLWGLDDRNHVILQMPERVILYTREWFAVHNQYYRWFVVRFQNYAVIEEIYQLTHDRRYIFPDQQTRLLKDITRHGT